MKNLKIAQEAMEGRRKGKVRYLNASLTFNTAPESPPAAFAYALPLDNVNSLSLIAFFF